MLKKKGKEREDIRKEGEETEREEGRGKERREMVDSGQVLI